MATASPSRGCPSTIHSLAPAPPARPVKILFLAADPIIISPLRLDEEARAIDRVLQLAQFRSHYELIQHWAVRASELQGILLRHRPDIVHFSGHGSTNNELILLDEAGDPQLVSATALGQLFGLFEDTIRCVVLNACYSYSQARVIAQYIDTVIGVPDAIGDQAARHFSTAFYQALGYGRSVRSAYELGCAQIALVNLAADTTPQLLALRSDPATLSFVKPAPLARDACDERSVAVIAAPPYTGPTPDSSPSAATLQPDRRSVRNRHNMLRLVREYWIEGVFQQSLHQRVLLRLGMAMRGNAVHPHLWDLMARNAEGPDILLPPDVMISELFQQMGRSVLILGAPGSGKSTTLLELAHEALQAAEDDVTRAMPVILSLTSWSEARRPLGEWVVEELRLKYNIPRKVAKEWVLADDLLFLLDGLDQVQERYRNECAVAINHFIEHHDVEIAVCCRTAEYSRMSESLQLQGALVLQPLTSEQIAQFLAMADLQTSQLARDIEHDDALRELAQTPLLLSIMCLTYDPAAGEPSNLAGTTLAERRSHLIARYVEQVLAREAHKIEYPPEQTKRQLTWLAQQLRQHGQTEFLIEGLQPSWLSSQAMRVVYEVGVRLSGGLIFVGGCAAIGVAAALVSPTATVDDGLFAGMMFGLLFWLPFAVASFLALIVPAFLAVAAVVLLLLIGSVLFTVLGGVQGGLLLGLVAGLPAAIGGVVFGARSTIRLADRLAWSWRRGLYGVGIGVLAGTILTLTGQDLYDAFSVAVVVAPAMVILLGFTRYDQVLPSTVPNQGIRRSAYNATFAGGLTFCTVFLLSTLVEFLVNDNLSGGMVFGLLLGFPLGLVALFTQGGVACLQHSWLRLIFALRRQWPWQCRPFLDFVTSAALLQRVGGGYRFVHTLVLDHFAHLDALSTTPKEG